MAQASSDRPLNERVVDFLYVLMRQVALPGDVEDVVKRNVEVRDQAYQDQFAPDVVVPPRSDTSACTFSNKGLEQYAREIAERLHAYV
jgi:hypothetical protein